MSIKSQISGWLRKLNLLSTAEQARFFFQKMKYMKENLVFKKEHPDFVLPPEFFIYETYRLNYKWYYEDGKNTAEEITDLCSRYFQLTGPGSRILDWGCGPGRIVRHFPSILPNAEIHGSDYNEKYIDWCRENLKWIKFSVNNIDPPMIYSDSYFDLVIGLSIFTHLSGRSHSKWVNELHRIVKLGGGTFITTQGNGYYTKLTEPEKKIFNADKLVTREYSDEGNRLYSSFQPSGFMKQLISGKFEILEYIEGNFENNESSQDSWVLRKI